MKNFNRRRFLKGGLALGGAAAIKSGMNKRSEAGIHRDTIEELGLSFSSEAQPLVVDVEGETHKLTGSAPASFEVAGGRS